MRSSIEKEDEKREGKMEERAGVGQMNFQSLTTSPRSEATFHDFRSRHHSRSAITQLAAGFYYFFLFFFAPGGNSVADGLVDDFSTKLLENSDVFKLSILAIHPASPFPPPRFSNRD